MRHKIRAGSKQVGDTIDGQPILSLSLPWEEQPTDDTACEYGLEPGLDWYAPIEFCWARV